MSTKPSAPALPADAIINSHGRKLSPPDKQVWFQRDEVTAMVNAALEASRASATSALGQSAEERVYKDAELLDFLDCMNGFKWLARQSVTGRGYRVHQAPDGVYDTARQAIRAAITDQKATLQLVKDATP